MILRESFGIKLWREHYNITVIYWQNKNTNKCLLLLSGLYCNVHWQFVLQTLHSRARQSRMMSAPISLKCIKSPSEGTKEKNTVRVRCQSDLSNNLNLIHQHFDEKWRMDNTFGCTEVGQIQQRYKCLLYRRQKPRSFYRKRKWQPL